MALGLRLKGHQTQNNTHHIYPICNSQPSMLMLGRIRPGTVLVSKHWDWFVGCVQHLIRESLQAKRSKHLTESVYGSIVSMTLCIGLYWLASQILRRHLADILYIRLNVWRKTICRGIARVGVISISSFLMDSQSELDLTSVNKPYLDLHNIRQISNTSQAFIDQTQKHLLKLSTWSKKYFQIKTFADIRKRYQEV